MLDALARAFSASHRHGSTQELVENIVNSAAAGRPKIINVAGHGDIAYFETGEGKHFGGHPDRYVSDFNRGVWRPQFLRLGNLGITRITIFSCEVAKPDPTDKGQNFLYSLMRATNTAIQAPTGDVYIEPRTGAILLSPGGIWVTMPYVPQLIDGPLIPPHLIHRALVPEGLERVREFEFDEKVSDDDISFDNVDQVSFQTYVVDETRTILSTLDASGIVAGLKNSAKYRVPGALLRASHGKLTLKRKNLAEIVFDAYRDGLFIERSKLIALQIEGRLPSIVLPER